MSYSRNLNMKDLINTFVKTENKKTVYNNLDLIPKNQEVFGHKKRIKPWRTGTKSQQQIVPKGFNKGFRG